MKKSNDKHRIGNMKKVWVEEENVGDVTVNNTALFLTIGGWYKDTACTLTFSEATFHK